MRLALIPLSAALASACTDSNYQNGNTPEPKANPPAETNVSAPVEYIIVVAEDVSLDAAMQHLQKYEATMLQDLKRGRYLISLRQNPGIDQLKGEVDETSDIVLIQPNYTYTTQ